MSRWNINTPTLMILSVVVAFMLVIVILPDVDLPATAFHRGTAPLVVHARATTPPPAVSVASSFQFPDTVESWCPDRNLDVASKLDDPNFRPILLRSIRR